MLSSLYSTSSLGGQKFFKSLQSWRYFNSNSITATIDELLSGKISKNEATRTLLQKSLGIKQVGNYAKLDMRREQRSGFPEVIFASGKSKDHLVDIMTSMSNDSSAKDNARRVVIATRVSEDQLDALKQALNEEIHYIASCKVAYTGNIQALKKTPGKVGVMCAGTSDYAVAEEAATILELSGVQCVTRLYDVGVAGIHRLLANIDQISDCDVVIVCAGMDGALPSVVGGLVRAPVIAVPTSVGYGASFGGVSAMLTMLNSCAPGVSVVNIDNGFGAAVCAMKTLKCFEDKYSSDADMTK